MYYVILAPHAVCWDCAPPIIVANNKTGRALTYYEYHRSGRCALSTVSLWFSKTARFLFVGIEIVSEENKKSWNVFSP